METDEAKHDKKQLEVPPDCPYYLTADVNVFGGLDLALDTSPVADPVQFRNYLQLCQDSGFSSVRLVINQNNPAIHLALYPLSVLGWRKLAPDSDLDALLGMPLGSGHGNFHHLYFYYGRVPRQLLSTRGRGWALHVGDGVLFIKEHGHDGFLKPIARAEIDGETERLGLNDLFAIDLAAETGIPLDDAKKVASHALIRLGGGYGVPPTSSGRCGLAPGDRFDLFVVWLHGVELKFDGQTPVSFVTASGTFPLKTGFSGVREFVFVKREHMTVPGFSDRLRDPVFAPAFVKTWDTFPQIVSTMKDGRFRKWSFVV